MHYFFIIIKGSQYSSMLITVKRGVEKGERKFKNLRIGE